MYTSLLTEAVHYFNENLAGELMNNFFKIFSVGCPVNLIINDNNNKRVGFDKFGKYVNEIPGSTVYRIPSGLSNSDSLTIIFVPSDRFYIATMNCFDNSTMRFEYYAPLTTTKFLSSYADINGCLGGHSIIQPWLLQFRFFE